MGKNSDDFIFVFLGEFIVCVWRPGERFLSGWEFKGHWILQLAEMVQSWGKYLSAWEKIIEKSVQCPLVSATSRNSFTG